MEWDWTFWVCWLFFALVVYDTCSEVFTSGKTS